ncbi:sulfotransferase domain-containing protein [Ketobacter alkanivorans]|uniref:Sulfotransferase domain-containing protein n=1 Tax=Ketobacter alkanivorans TaxID=1917421 RepID=A0A2K9LN12_9GAMM|nr:sulfotransferase domain-containing protein [Ketobacter alkanivorans]AUM13746.1 hypothetical protein Kalk_15520 [Ketobacter alkanivorans]
MESSNNIPSFIFIGPDKTGSSWLFEYLRSHPQCFVPECKDIYFFDRYFKKGASWYLSFFKSVNSNFSASGEICHDYLFSLDAANRIYSFNPEIKLLTSLRNPVDRSFSHYLYLVRSGITKTDFWSAIEEHPEIIDNSLYFKHLNGYFGLFPRQHICILDFSTLKNSQSDYAATICEFLGIDFYDPSNIGIVRSAEKARSFYIAKLLKTMASLVRDLGFPNLVGKIKHSRIILLLYRSYRNEEMPTLSPSDRTSLEQYFIEDTKHLDSLIGTTYVKNWFGA